MALRWERSRGRRCGSGFQVALAFTTILVPPAAPGLALLLVTRNGIFDFFPVKLINHYQDDSSVNQARANNNRQGTSLSFYVRLMCVLRWQTPNLSMLDMKALLNQVHPRENYPLS